MNFSPDKFSEHLPEFAKRQLSDYDSNQPGTIFSEGITLGVEQAYQLQHAVSQLRIERGEILVGFKVGCTSPVIRKQLGIDHCIFGRLYESEKFRTVSTLSRKSYCNLAIEGELAVELSCAPTRDHFAKGEVPSCIKRIFPVIELHNHIVRGKEPSASELVANNAIHAGIVAGKGITSEESSFGEFTSASPTLSIHADENCVEQYNGPLLLETISTSLFWLMEELKKQHLSLASGQIVLTGSLPSLIPVTGNCKITVNAPPFGKVEANFTS